MAIVHPSAQSPAPYVIEQKPAVIPISRKWHIAKIVLRVWSILLAIIILILAGVAINMSTAPLESDASRRVAVGGIYILSFPPACVAVVWDAVELITLWVRRKTTGRGTHPGAQVGVDLILWLWLLCVSTLLSFTIFFVNDIYSYTYDDEIYSKDDRQQWQALCSTMTATTVFIVLILITHFVLFVRACVETHQRRRALARGGPIMVIPAPGFAVQEST